MTGATPERFRAYRVVARVLTTTGVLLVVGGIYLAVADRQVGGGGMIFGAGLLDLLMAYLLWQRAA